MFLKFYVIVLGMKERVVLWKLTF